MADNQPPPLRWVFDKAERRGEFLRYWVRDPIVGIVNFAIHYGVRLLPIDVASAIGGALGAFAKFRYPQSDVRARKLWITVRPNEAAKVDAAVNKLWRNVGRTMAEFSVLDRLWAAGRIEVVGREHLDAAHKAGPMIGLGVHLGNWETIGVAMLSIGFKGGSIYEPPANRFDHIIANRARSRLPGDAILARPNAAAEAFIRLTREKQQIVLYADELARGRVWAPAFGRPLQRGGNIGNAVRLARLANAQIFPLYSVRLNERAQFRVTILPAVKLIKTADREADLMANIAMIDALFEPIIRDHLDQWFFGLDFDFAN
jgi:KDO2-lipid IV(A) lauroyltransferase